jgi:hypothetical protein
VYCGLTFKCVPKVASYSPFATVECCWQHTLIVCSGAMSAVLTRSVLTVYCEILTLLYNSLFGKPHQLAGNCYGDLFLYDLPKLLVGVPLENVVPAWWCSSTFVLCDVFSITPIVTHGQAEEESLHGLQAPLDFYLWGHQNPLCMQLLLTMKRHHGCLSDYLQVPQYLWMNVAVMCTDLMEDILGTYYKCALSAITHKLNVSAHMLLWKLFLVLVCGNRAQSFPRLLVTHCMFTYKLSFMFISWPFFVYNYTHYIPHLTVLICVVNADSSLLFFFMFFISDVWWSSRLPSVCFVITYKWVCKFPMSHICQILVSCLVNYLLCLLFC